MELEQFTQIFPNCKDPEGWVGLFDHLDEYNITTPEQVAAFCSQVGHESMDLNVLQENLNYSADRLKVVFPKYFRNVDVKAYHRNPEKIANRVYANRMGNGPPESGDGWRYRGSGIIQLTGYNNFAAASKYLYSDELILLDRPEFVREDKEVAILCALWYWEQNRLSSVEDIREVSRIVNGGENGLEDRIERYERALEILRT
jgi:putative chitinase